MKCFACDQLINGQYSFVYCRMSYETYKEKLEELKHSNFILKRYCKPKWQARIKIVDGRHRHGELGRLQPVVGIDRYIGHSPGRYQEYYEINHTPRPDNGWIDRIIGRGPTTYKCYLHAACHLRYLRDKKQFGVGSPKLDCYFNKPEHRPSSQELAEFEHPPTREVNLTLVRRPPPPHR